MAHIHTHYDNLKVARNAPPEVIRAAYKSLSQKYHPDRNPDSPDAMRIIQIINSAYEVLSDPVKRAAHDAWIAKTEASIEPKKSSMHGPQQRSHEPARPPSNSAHRSSAYAHKPPQYRPTSLNPLQKFEAMLDNLFRSLLRKMRHAPVSNRRR
jgi:curved DNA-binding protein CbpA